MKRTFSTELAYVFGIVFVARGVVLMEKADFGVSMVVAPAYLLYRWLSPVWSFVSFGMAEIFRTGHCDANERRAKRLVSLHAGAQTNSCPACAQGSLTIVGNVAAGDFRSCVPPVPLRHVFSRPSQRCNFSLPTSPDALCFF